MNDMQLPVKRIRRAQIRYFETEFNACEIPDFSAYTYFLKVDGTYINIFHPTEECNVYERVPVPNYTKSGESFGSKIKLVTGNVEDGVCYILDNPDRLISNEEYISVKDFENMIINMEEFVVDRIDILERRTNPISRFKNRKIIESDLIKLQELQEFVLSKEGQKVYKKN